MTRRNNSTDDNLLRKKNKQSQLQTEENDEASEDSLYNNEFDGNSNFNPVPFSTIEKQSKEKIIKTLHAKSLCGCWGCDNYFGFEDINTQKSGDGVTMLWNIYTTHNLHCSLPVLARKIHDAYMTYIYEPLILSNQGDEIAVIWKVEEIIYHIETVILDPARITRQMIGKYNRLALIIEDGLVYKDANGCVAVQKNALSGYLSLNKEIISLLNLKRQ